MLRAADKFATTKRAEILAATMAGQVSLVKKKKNTVSIISSILILLQAKSVIQAEIDAGPELIDFLRFNVQYAHDLVNSQPLSPEAGVTNHVEYRGLEVGITDINNTVK